MPVVKQPRGGHFPGYLREAFENAVEAMHDAWPYPRDGRKARSGSPTFVW